MTCENLSDRMPLVAAGAATFTDAEAAHLAQCGDCAAEWRIVNGARDASLLPGSFSPARVSDGVLRRLAEAPPVRTIRPRILGLAGIAAAAAILLLMLRSAGPVPAPAEPAEPVAFAIPLMELDSLDQDELRLVLESLDEPLGTPAGQETPSMMDLDDQQLERVLRSLEG